MLLMTLACISPDADSSDNPADCQSEYDNLSRAHTGILEEQAADTPAFFESLHEIENRLFSAFERCPKNTLLFTLMGEVQISLGNVQLALLYAQKAYSWDNSSWQTHHLLGSALSMQGEYKQGLVHLEKAVNINNDKPELSFNLCSTYLAAREFNKAIETCTKVIARKDHKLHALAFHVRGQAYEALDMEKQARQDFKNAKTLGYAQ